MADLLDAVPPVVDQLGIYATHARNTPGRAAEAGYSMHENASQLAAFAERLH